MTSYTIPIYQPDLGGNEKQYVNECLDTTWISSRGRFIQEFEQRFSERVGIDHAAAVSNGTVALHLALLALGIGQGDEVIVPTLTYIASVNAITYAGATPVFADSDRETWQIDPDDVQRLVTPRTKAIVVVHLYGQACEMDALTRIAREHGVFIIEDCAEAFGTLYHGRHVGAFGDIGTFSFFGNKTITTGEGGMVVTRDKTLIERVRHLKGQGLAAHREYWHDIVGYNYRMTNVAAAIGVAQLERASEFIARKREIARQYSEGLRRLPVQMQPEVAGTFHSYWMCAMLVESAEDRDPLREQLAAAGIETRPIFYPVHTMPMYSGNFRKRPCAEDIAWRGVVLPSWPGLSTRELEKITSEIQSYFA